MTTFRPIALLLAASASVAAAPEQRPAERAIAVSRAAATPEDVFGPLYRAVELARVFPDSKTFADMVPLENPQVILAAYATDKPDGRVALAAFVARHFRTTGGTAERKLTMREHIKALWPILAKPPLAVVPGSSALQLPYAYVVAGGRYQEMYYWDSYFTMLGLKADGETPLVESMLANFTDMVERYGHVPNGTRAYYLSRSQPPFLSLMMDLSDAHDPALIRRRLDALKAEHAYWMAGGACIDSAGACQHVVRMPDGSLLNRYWDARDTPREESYAEDVATAAAAAPRPAGEVDRDLRAGGESGWDFGSRWLRDGHTLATIHTTDIVPVDLNSLLWSLERSIARRCAAAGDAACAADFERQAARRATAISKYLWSASDRRFVDWDRVTGRPTASISAAVVVPLFVGLATPAQADATAQLVQAMLVAPGGLRTTTLRTGQQWDQPNGWAPLLWMGVSGLDRYGKTALADDLARRWMRTVSGFYACTGRMVEKYDVERGQAGGGGEYPVQDGFGWTNGVTRMLLDRPALGDAIKSSC
ncbi:alpha,alpha-trehalase TreF [Sphingomonas nostoxanthinifaciens]|uniref:alpha,alpha-trehalase TreF n=1 Tax=Sphingomonas nostoxanthinifaciens TaxID=2872652 RepID=UPI001CC21465|nr:alpha,alpha-trehalase TreF [Sphingomonas nostoxanthinifaciens]UAK25949.1 alpha,alpha-trehalase TreF [Sphingomonas nostoxanthinifaciens]